MSKTNAQFTISWTAIALRCIQCPINPRNLANAAEVTHMFKTTMSAVPVQRAILVTTEPNMVNSIDQLGLFDDAIKIVVAPPSETPQGWVPFEQLMDQSHAPSVQANGLNGTEEQFVDALVLFTSGTTSTPKGVLKQHRNSVSFMTRTGTHLSTAQM
jgi:acyl-CoA synthetase (AMP-forming)/AMP-acid ligase II